MPQLSGIILAGAFVRPVAAGLALRMYGADSGYVGLAPAAAAGSTTYILPAADGESGQVLSTDGDGALEWITPPGVTDHGALDGLADDDHPQYVRRNVLTTNGDLFVRSSGDVTRLAAGSNGQVLVVSSGLPTWTSLTTSGVSEGSNQYFTDARARAAMTGAASSIAGSDLTASRALASDSSGKVAVVTVTAAELNHLSGVTSAIQSQLGGKESTISVLPLNKGGTGRSSTPANGQLLIGDGSGYSLATLTAGSNVSITNGAGSITIAASGGGSSPGGSEGDLQFHTSGTFDGSSNLNWDDDDQVLHVNHTISTTDAEFVLEQTGDSFGTTRFRLRNRAGFNGFVVENAGLDLADMLFTVSSASTGVVRYEHRSGSLFHSGNSAGEFQFSPNSWDMPLIVGADAVMLNSPKLGFFGDTPVTRREKSYYNGWTSLTDVVQALVDLGLFDEV